MTTTKVTLTELKLEECHDCGIFNGSYFITAQDPSPRAFDDERIVVCRFPTGCGEFSEQKPIAEYVLKAIQCHDELLNALELAQATIKRLERHAPGSANGTLDVIALAIAKATK